MVNKIGSQKSLTIIIVVIKFGLPLELFLYVDVCVNIKLKPFRLIQIVRDNKYRWRYCN